MEWNKKDIREAARNFSQWQGDAVIMCDVSDGSVWTDIFSGENDWAVYHSETIKKVVSKRGILERDMKIGTAALELFLEKEIYKYRSCEEMPQEVKKILYHYGF